MINQILCIMIDVYTDCPNKYLLGTFLVITYKQVCFSDFHEKLFFGSSSF